MLPGERGALDVRVEQDVERFAGLAVHGVVGHDDELVEEGLVGRAAGDAFLLAGEQVERDHAGVVGAEQSGVFAKTVDLARRTLERVRRDSAIPPR